MRARVIVRVTVRVVVARVRVRDKCRVRNRLRVRVRPLRSTDQGWKISSLKYGSTQGMTN